MRPQYLYLYGTTVNGALAMKTGIATTLSVLGVIAAGAAAYAVNTSVLGAAASDTVAVLASAGSPATVATQPNSPNVSGASIETVENMVSGDTTTYKVGSAGSVVVDTSSGSIVVTNILPAAGFTSEPARTDSNGAVKVHFVSATQRIEFVARMVNGAVVVDVKNETPAPGVSQPPARHHDDDDDHDEREERHDDDDDYEDGDDD